MAAHYDKLFLDWQATTYEQANILSKIFKEYGFDSTAKILDCACGIGTQAIGLARLGYNVTASDISDNEIAEAKIRAADASVKIRFAKADFRKLSNAFEGKFDIIIAMDNALPHMLSHDDLEKAINSISGQIEENGIFVGSIRDYDTLLKDKPPYSPPYKLTQYIIEDSESLKTSKFECEYRAVSRDEITDLFLGCGCKDVIWKFPEETGFYQPIIIARK